MKNRRKRKAGRTNVRTESIIEGQIHRSQLLTIHALDSLFLVVRCISCSRENDPLADFVALQSKNERRRSSRDQGCRMNVIVLAEAPVRAIFIEKVKYCRSVGNLEDIPSEISITKLQIRSQKVDAPLST